MRSADRSESVFLAPAAMDDGTSPLAGGPRTRAKSDDEESVASIASRSSLASSYCATTRGTSGKKRRIATTTPDVPEDLAIQIRTSSAADVSAGLIMHVSEIMRVATTSSNLKGTYIRALKDAASYITAAWKCEAARRSAPERDSDIAATRLVEARRLAALEEENAFLRQELSQRAARAHECPRCAGPPPDYGGRPPPSREGRSDRARIDALERAVQELGPSIVRKIEERFGGRRQRTPVASRSAERPAVLRPTPLPREQEGGEWRLAEARKRRRKKRKEPAVVAGGEAARKGAVAAPPPTTRGASQQQQQQQQPRTRTTSAPKTTVAAANRGPPPQPAKTVTLPRAPRTSAVTLTLNEGARMSYADVLETARAKVPLSELGVESVQMRKAMTGAIIIRVPGDRDRGKASQLATRLAEVLDPTAVKVATPNRMAELRVTGIDISVKEDEVRRALASAAGCGCAEVQVGEIGATRGGLGSAWIKCPVAGARKLAQAGKISLGWSTARIRAIPKRPLQCYKCLELGHVRATCVSTVDRGHLCYRCGGSGHRARGCPASAPKCPLCESLGAPANHRMGGAACAPPKTKRRRPTRQPAAAAAAAAERTPGSTATAAATTTAAAAVDGREEAMETGE